MSMFDHPTITTSLLFGTHELPKLKSHIERVLGVRGVVEITQHNNELHLVVSGDKVAWERVHAFVRGMECLQRI